MLLDGSLIAEFMALLVLVSYYNPLLGATALLGAPENCSYKIAESSKCTNLFSSWI